MNILAERLHYLFDKKGVTPYYVAEKTGISEATISRLLNKKSAKPSIRTNDLLAEHFKVNSEWLLTGHGNPELEDNDEAPLLDREIGRPLLSFEMLKHLDTFDFRKKINGIDYFIVPEFEKKGFDFLISMPDHSMQPKYNNGDVLACKRINEITFFQWGRVYVMVSEQGLMVKRIFEDVNNKNNIICKSEDEEKYPPFSLPKTEIKNISIIVGAILLD